ncbi:MAG TPA: putative sulfate exporter family transporter [Brevundimonas sp.]|nr:putative sulfate exporter family transporter [Brevundimonas sp.]
MIPASSTGAPRPSGPITVLSLIPGFALCVAVTLMAWLVQMFELRLFDRAWVETLVLAILIGVAIRSVWTPPAIMRPGVEFTARTLLEVAIVLLGGSVSAATVMAIGPGMLLGTAVVVAAAIGVSYALGRLFRLPRRMAVLIACGNAICGNSAIAAVAPVIDAKADDVSAAIAFTAVLGVAVVLLLPLLGLLTGMEPVRYGALAGLTVYAVPQVLAATVPLGATAVQSGTLIKLVRVLLLGPVCLALSLVMARRRKAHVADGGGPVRRARLSQLVPWFIIGFLLMMGARSLVLIPAAVLPIMADTAMVLTVLSMAALGLGADARALVRSGPRIAAVVVLSLLSLVAMALALIHLLAVI